MSVKRKSKRKSKTFLCETEATPLEVEPLFAIDKTAVPIDESLYSKHVEVEESTLIEESRESDKRKRKLEHEERYEKKRQKDEQEEKLLSGIIFNLPEDVTLPEANQNDSDSESAQIHDEILQPAWNDIDDEKIVSKEAALQQTTSERLRERFQDAYGDRPSWANKHLRKETHFDGSYQGSDSDEDVERLLMKNTKLTERPNTLRPSFISITQLTDANKSHRPDAAMRCVEFHPRSQLLLSAGLHKTLDIFQIDGKRSTRIQGVHIENFPIYTAHFASQGEEIILNSNKAHFFVYNLKNDKIQKIFDIRGHPKEYFQISVPSPKDDVIAFLGKDGYIVLLSARTKQWISELKMNGTVRSVAFAKNGNLMLSGGSDGEVYVWDMNTRDCVNKFRDEGSGVIHSISASNSESPLVAVGSDSGIVNVYDSTSIYSTQKPKPVKTYKNLTTSITSSAFSPTNEILGFFSYRNKQAVRLANTNTNTVFSNWPKQESNFGYINSLHFSYNSKYMALGNDIGRVMLYRLNHFLDK